MDANTNTRTPDEVAAPETSHDAARAAQAPTGRSDHNVWVGLSYDDPHAARAWLRALGFLDGVVVDGESAGEVRHSEMLWPEGGRVMVSSRARTDRTFVSAPGAATVYVVVDEPDAVWSAQKRWGRRCCARWRTPSTARAASRWRTRGATAGASARTPADAYAPQGPTPRLPLRSGVEELAAQPVGVGP